MMPYKASEGDVMNVTFDNQKQVDVVERIYVGMTDGYQPTWSEDTDALGRGITEVDTHGHDYVSVTDGILALLGIS